MRKEKSIALIILGIISIVTIFCNNRDCDEHAYLNEDLMIKAPNNSHYIFANEFGDTVTHKLTYYMDVVTVEKNVGCKYTGDQLVVYYGLVYSDSIYDCHLHIFIEAVNSTWGAGEYDMHALTQNGRDFYDILIFDKCYTKWYYSCKHGLLKFERDSITWELVNFDELFPEYKKNEK